MRLGRVPYVRARQGHLPVSASRFLMRIRSIAAPLALAALLTVPVGAQSLRGSPASVDRMYRQAQEHELHFFRTGRGVRRAADEGRLVRMSGNGDYRVAD